MIMTTITELREQGKRSHHGFLLNDPSKRLKTTNTAAISFPTKEKKDGLGERVAALQQLVSPFGKTDTASVLLEATEYIKFLHDQLQVLSTPYLRTQTGVVQDAEYYSLSNRGLCLMPLASAHTIVRSNGADLWAPSNTTKLNYKLYVPAQFDHA